MSDRTGTYTVVEPCNDHGTTTLREHPRNSTVHVVEYGDSEVESALSDLDAGTVVRVELEREGRRGNAWRAEAARPVSADPA
ncbi:hypothetical protein [Halorubrum pallidum]